MHPDDGCSRSFWNVGTSQKRVILITICVKYPHISQLLQVTVDRWCTQINEPHPNATPCSTARCVVILGARGARSVDAFPPPPLQPAVPRTASEHRTINDSSGPSPLCDPVSCSIVTAHKWDGCVHVTTHYQYSCFRKDAAAIAGN